MPDFASALYLGLRHASESLGPWAQLTAGKPAALAEPPAARHVAAGLAALTGVEGAVLARSTLHAFFDLFGALGREPGRILVDEGAYPIARWGAERAACRGVPLSAFRHHDADALRRLLDAGPDRPGRPWIVTDGFCVGCGRLAPLADYAALARRHGGRLVVDDTQALGILGADPHPGAPYGRGGGGSLRAGGVAGPEILLVASLAKGFGAPLAVVGGPRRVIERFSAGSETRVHGSPASQADLLASERALSINATSGEMLRLRLAALVARFRRGVLRLGLTPGPSSFPVQRVGGLPEQGAAALHDRLEALGVRCVLHRPVCARQARVAFLLTARHAPAEIDEAIRAIDRALRGSGVAQRG